MVYKITTSIGSTLYQTGTAALGAVYTVAMTPFRLLSYAFSLVFGGGLNRQIPKEKIEYLQEILTKSLQEKDGLGVPKIFYKDFDRQEPTNNPFFINGNQFECKPIASKEDKDKKFPLFINEIRRVQTDNKKADILLALATQNTSIFLLKCLSHALRIPEGAFPLVDNDATRNYKIQFLENSLEFSQDMTIKGIITSGGDPQSYDSPKTYRVSAMYHLDENNLHVTVEIGSIFKGTATLPIPS